LDSNLLLHAIHSPFYWRIFPFYKMLSLNKVEFPCFADFLYGFLKPE
jgi:hypothetical protein